MTPTVSALVPLYDGERYVAETLESILSQTHPPDEVIVADDASTDRGPEIVAGYAPQVTLVRRSRRGWGSAARNTAVAAASGELLAVCDADDLWEPTKLEHQLAAFAADPDLEACFTALSEFVSPDVDPTTLPMRPANERSDTPLTSTMVVRRATFDRVGPFDESLTIGDFWEWYSRLSDDGARQQVLPEVLVRRRLHGNNNSLREAASSAEYLHIIKGHLDRRRGTR